LSARAGGPVHRCGVVEHEELGLDDRRRRRRQQLEAMLPASQAIRYFDQQLPGSPADLFYMFTIVDDAIKALRIPPR
jgi:hypothetical protein